MERPLTSADFLVSDGALSSRPTTVRSLVLGAAVVFSIAVFLIDTYVMFDIAIAVLYVAVVLVSASAFDRRGILVVSVACMTLTVLSFVIQHDTFYSAESIGRCFVSLLAIAITAILAVRIQSTTATLRSQAQLLDLTHDAIFVRDMNDVITYWNRGAEKLYGWPASDAMGQLSRRLVQTRLPAPYDEVLAQLLRTGRWEGELVHTKRDGATVTVASRWSLQRDERGQPTSILETNTDIEETKQAQEILARTQAELAHVSRVSTMGELTASIAHEVNQPLAAIVTSGEACLRWLDRDVPQLDGVKRGVERMIGDGRRASEVVRRLRALSRKGDLQKTAVDLNEVIDDVLPLIQREIFNHRVALELDLSTSLPAVPGDRVQLQQVVINLLMNAIQAMATLADGRRELVLRSRAEDDGQVLVAIQDSGPGFAPESEDQLFNAFFTTKSDGMGMGLSICRSIIDAHGGHIWASREAAGGATFQFVLPSSTESAP
ncbi:MAG: sensor histidine kinase [Rhodospirillales bacterium]|nr:sensor histidine kinase [Rhodospirillales bacterium]